MSSTFGNCQPVRFSPQKLLSLLPWRELLLSLPGLVIFYLALHYYWDFVSDDAYISFRYAEHLATGRGLEWNPDYRVEGYTNFLWVVLIALLRVFGAAAPDGARALAWLAGGATMLLIVLIARREQKARPSWTLLALAPIPLALTFPYQYWTSLRLETPLFAMLMLLATYLFVREEDNEEGRQWPSALAYLALALTRPEGAAFIAVPGIYLLSRVRPLTLFTGVFRQRRSWLAVYFGGLLGYHLWRVLYFGDIFPNTYYAKVSGSDLLTRGSDYVLRFAAERPYQLVLAIGVLLLAGAASRMGLLLLGKVALLVTVVIFEGGDWMREWRLLMPVTPLLVAGLGAAAQRFAASRELPVRLSTVAGVVVLCLGIQSSMGTPRREWPDILEGKHRSVLINLEGELTRVSKEVGLWLRAQPPRGALIAVNHAGAVPFYSDLPAIDMAGLNDKHIARVPGTRHFKWDPDYVLAQKPTFIVLNTRAEPTGGVYLPGYWKGETLLTERPAFQRNYEPVSKYWTWRHQDLAHRRNRGFSSSYIMVFRRVDRYRKIGKCQGFENGKFADFWAVSGEAFGKAPASGPKGHQRVEGAVGRYLANSYPANDAPAGLLTSDPFEIKGNRLEFLVGGAADPAKAGVRLKVDGRIVLQANGRNDGRLRLNVWEVSAMKGKTAVLEIYDNGPGPWGHVIADEFCQFEVMVDAVGITGFKAP